MEPCRAIVPSLLSYLLFIGYYTVPPEKFESEKWKNFGQRSGRQRSAPHALPPRLHLLGSMPHQPAQMQSPANCDVVTVQTAIKGYNTNNSKTRRFSP